MSHRRRFLCCSIYRHCALTTSSALRKRLLAPRLFSKNLTSPAAGMDSAAKNFPGVSLKELPKSNNFTSKLPPDPAFPTPESSAAAPLSELGPRMVKEGLYTFVRPEPPSSTPELLAVSKEAFKTLGLKPGEERNPEFLSLVSGQKSGFEDEVYPWAQCYGGWQFGQWAGQLGDGRAISLFEATNPSTDKRYELQLKGAGKTPYSRFADGKAVLRSSIREFVVSEYLHSIGIPTTRALALTLLPGDRAVRERVEPCAIVTRFSESWVRIGTFDIFRWRGDRVRLRALADYVRSDVLGLGEFDKDSYEGFGEDGGNRYEEMYREIVKRNAKTVAKWQVYGFMNGVLNTDNTSVMGLSLDFGPFAFMDDFDPSYTPNHDDHTLRYAYTSQPTIIWWNLVRLAEDLAELFSAPPSLLESPEFATTGIEDPAQASALIKNAEAIISRCGEEYKATFLAEYRALFAARLGFMNYGENKKAKVKGKAKVLEEEKKDEEADEEWDEIGVETLLDILEKYELDYHHFFRRLSEFSLDQYNTDPNPSTTTTTSPTPDLKTAVTIFFPAISSTTSSSTSTPPSESAKSELATWLESYKATLHAHAISDAQRIPAMKALNPKFVPKNWVLDELIERVEKRGEREILERVMKMVEKPFEDSWGGDLEEEKRWTGDVPRYKKAIQCSCSS